MLVTTMFRRYGRKRTVTGVIAALVLFMWLEGTFKQEWNHEPLVNTDRPLRSVETDFSANQDKVYPRREPPIKKERLYFVNGENCKIPRLNPWDETIAKIVSPLETDDCREVASLPDLTYSNKDVIYVNRTVMNLLYKNIVTGCQLKEIVRTGKNTDTSYGYSPSIHNIYFNDSVQVPFEFCQVFCYDMKKTIIYTNLYAFAPLKPSVLKTKLDKFKVHRQSSGNDEFPNVLLIGIDSVSQLNFHRKFSQTRNFLINELGAEEMYGYTKVADNTFPNLTPFFEGAFLEELGWNKKTEQVPFDDHDFIWKTYSASGYQTLYGQDVTDYATWNYLKEGFWKQPTDYYYRPFALAANQHKGMWSKNHRCFGQRSDTEMLLDYTQKFIEMSAGKPYFSFSYPTGATHNLVNYHTDDLHLKFLKNLKDGGVLNNTFIFYFGDHGMRMGSILNHYIGKIEERMPAMYIVPPTWFRQSYPHLLKNLQENGNRLTTPFDMHETLRHLLNFKQSVAVVSKRTNKGHMEPRGISLLNRVPSNRSCSSAGVSEHWCPCLSSKPVSVKLPAVAKAAKEVVASINSRIIKAGHTDKCAHLLLDEVTDALEAQPLEKVVPIKPNNDIVINKHGLYEASAKVLTAQYLITVKTSPGGALFESTVQYSEGGSSPNDRNMNEEKSDYSVSNDISRINVYGTTGDCVQSHVLQMFCYCV